MDHQLYVPSALNHRMCSKNVTGLPLRLGAAPAAVPPQTPACPHTRRLTLSRRISRMNQALRCSTSRAWPGHLPSPSPAAAGAPSRYLSRRGGLLANGYVISVQLAEGTRTTGTSPTPTSLSNVPACARNVRFKAQKGLACAAIFLVSLLQAAHMTGIGILALHGGAQRGARGEPSR